MQSSLTRLKEKQHKLKELKKTNKEPKINESITKTIAITNPERLDANRGNKSTSNPSDASNDSRLRTITPPVTLANKKPEQLNKDEVELADLNLEQRTAVNLTVESNSFCLIGPAGSGKTTAVKCMIKSAMNSGKLGTMSSLQTTEKLFNVGMPSVAILSFTNQAVRNIRSSMPTDLKANCSTIHNLLEFMPVEFTDLNDLDKNQMPKTKMVFAPRYGVLWNQAGGEILPHIDLIVIEEAGSVALELFELLMSALPTPEKTQFIFLGDLNQNPPVFDDAILGFKQLELPVIELTKVYRNVGIVTKLAHRVLEGKPISDNEAISLNEIKDKDEIKFIRFQKKYYWEEAVKHMGMYLKTQIIKGLFDETNSVVLIPFNVKFGQQEINRWMQQGISERDGKEVYEIIARFVSSYHSIGDRVLYDRNYYKIIDIKPNLAYTGKKTAKPSKYLTRFGSAKKGHREEVFGAPDLLGSTKQESAEDLLERIDVETASETNQSSHIITLEGIEINSTLVIKGANINSMLPTYCMTIHKAQGSEWENVHLIFHHSHSIMCNREMLYTGITRARHKITIYYSGNYSGGVTTIKQSTLHKCLVNQQITGKTLKEKLDFFRGRARSYIAQKGKKTNSRGKTLEKLVELKTKGLL